MVTGTCALGVLGIRVGGYELNYYVYLVVYGIIIYL